MIHNIQSRAADEAEKAADWYDSQRPGLGVEFILELDAAIDKAAQCPLMYALQHREARRVLLRRFPYAVYFIFEHEIIEIFAVLHQQSNPARW